MPALSDREDRFWQPDVTVATVVVDDGRMLFVEERVSGALVLNQPAGHLEPDEALADAALRETLEETGWTVALTAFIGAYQWTAPTRAGEGPGRQFLRFAFAATPVAHDPGRRLDQGIERALWLSPEALSAQRERHRSPLVSRVVDDFLGGRRYPLALLQQVAP